MRNGVFAFLIFASILLAASTGRMEPLTDAILKNGRTAVELAIGLVGVMALFLGLMRVAEEGGLLRIVSRAAAPVMRRLFPDVPADHPAMSAMVFNISANMLGLANAATPFGIKAIEGLNELNPRKGTATDAMVLFLAINTAGFAILPTTVLGVRVALGSEEAAAILFPTWFASGCATLVAILAALLLSRLPRYRRSSPGTVPFSPEANETGIEASPEKGTVPSTEAPTEAGTVPRWRLLAIIAFFLAYAALMALHLLRSYAESTALELTRQITSHWILPAIVAALVLVSWSRGVRVYDALVEGAKEGFQVALRIIPYLVAILVGVGMFRASGGIDLIARGFGPLTGWIGMPAEALPMALLRPLTGSGALAVMSEIMTEHGPDSPIGYLVSTFQGSTETTFYVLAVYFGAVGIRRTRHTLPACLLADAAGILAAVFIVNLFLG